MGKSSKKTRPSKPYPEFPFYAHASGRWAKKTRGKLHYFGKWQDDPEGKAALNRNCEQRDALYAGRTPSTRKTGLTVKDLCDRFLYAKESKVISGELAPVTFRDYYATCLRVRSPARRQAANCGRSN
jgi:hypothetical protein